jgi:hypothetical protein
MLRLFSLRLQSESLGVDMLAIEKSYNLLVLKEKGCMAFA